LKEDNEEEGPVTISSEIPNGDGKLDKNELRQIFNNKGLTDGEIKDLFNTIDINNDNVIDETEWREFHRIFIEPY